MGIDKQDVDLIKLDLEIKKSENKQGATKYFKAPIVQKNCSENYYLPEKSIFSLPIRFVNYFFNLANSAEKKVKNNNALEYFLTEVVNVEKLLQLIPQRAKESDNQARRLYKAIAHVVGSKKKAENIIENQPEELKKQIMKSVKLGKKLTYFDKIKDRARAA